MTGFAPRTSGFGSGRTTNWATTAIILCPSKFSFRSWKYLRTIQSKFAVDDKVFVFHRRIQKSGAKVILLHGHEGDEVSAEQFILQDGRQIGVDAFETF